MKLPDSLHVFEPLREVSRSGHATVLRGLDPDGGRAVAIKLFDLPAQTEESSPAVESFRKHAAALRGISDPHLPSVLREGFGRGRAFLVTSWVEGMVLEAPCDLEPSSLMKRTADLLRCLEALARYGQGHLNLRPNNLLLGRDGRLHLLGLGSGHLLDLDPDELTAPELPVLKAAGGTLWRADLYALAVTLCQLLGARYEGAGSSLPWVGLADASRDSLRGVEGLRLVLESAMHQQPVRRPASFGVVRRAILNTVREHGHGRIGDPSQTALSLEPARRIEGEASGALVFRASPEEPAKPEEAKPEEATPEEATPEEIVATEAPVSSQATDELEEAVPEAVVPEAVVAAPDDDSEGSKLAPVIEELVSAGPEPIEVVSAELPVASFEEPAEPAEPPDLEIHLEEDVPEEDLREETLLAIPRQEEIVEVEEPSPEEPSPEEPPPEERLLVEAPLVEKPPEPPLPEKAPLGEVVAELEPGVMIEGGPDASLASSELLGEAGWRPDQEIDPTLGGLVPEGGAVESSDPEVALAPAKIQLAGSVAAEATSLKSPALEDAHAGSRSVDREIPIADETSEIPQQQPHPFSDLELVALDLEANARPAPRLRAPEYVGSESNAVLPWWLGGLSGRRWVGWLAIAAALIWLTLAGAEVLERWLLGRAEKGSLPAPVVALHTASSSASGGRAAGPAAQVSLLSTGDQTSESEGTEPASGARDTSKVGSAAEMEPRELAPFSAVEATEEPAARAEPEVPEPLDQQPPAQTPIDQKGGAQQVGQQAAGQQTGAQLTSSQQDSAQSAFGPQSALDGSFFRPYEVVLAQLLTAADQGDLATLRRLLGAQESVLDQVMSLPGGAEALARARRLVAAAVPLSSIRATAESALRAGRPHRGLEALANTSPGQRSQLADLEERLRLQLAELDDRAPSLMVGEWRSESRLRLRADDDYELVAVEAFGREDDTSPIRRLEVTEIGGGSYEVEVPSTIRQLWGRAVDRGGREGRLGSDQTPVAMADRPD